jgi:hypothetical protein
MSNELMNTQNNLEEVGQTQSMCSFKVETLEEKKILFKVATAPDHNVAEFIGKTINIKDVYAEVVHMTNPDTGEVTDGIRMVIIDDKGVSYQCVSSGMWNAFSRMRAIFGNPTYEPAIPIEIKQIDKGVNKKILSFDII